jgi:hypothetical protein
MTRVPDTCVLHLVRERNGIEPVKAFIESYLQRRSGLDHALVVIMKGFRETKAPAEYAALLENIPHEFIFLPDVGYDITSYVRAAEALDYTHFFFLNSFSVILGDDWLVKFRRHASDGSVGLVGATGSWESIYTDLLRQHGTIKSTPGALLRRVAVRARLVRWVRYFHPFPNYHIRTNAFMMRQELLDKIRLPRLRTKMDAWRFESGKEGLSQQVLRLGHKLLVVGKDGMAYEKGDWFRSGTFWKGNQENLLVADNQTRRYMEGDGLERQRLSRLAWGEQAT